ncbi:MAG TPA: LamG-like jellyroll fold domain-containing protein, partial [Pirellulaceae bacterium]|nr:LamG-like jellyroll fold domain-containing protein [Pirellulaceae bacterium]
MLESLEDRRLLAITAGGPGGFELPVPSSDLEIWLDASDVNADGSAATNGALIANWQDKSGNDRDFSDLLGDPNYVTAGSNGQPTVNFDGDDALRTNLTTSNPRNFIDGNGEFTLLSVSRYSGADRERVIAARTAHNWLFGYHGGSLRRWHYDAWGSQDVGGIQNDTNWHLHANLMNVTNVPTNPAGDFYLDGTLLTDNGTGTLDAFANNVPDGLSLGAWNGLAESSTAEVSELVMFNRVLNDLEHRLVQNYLSSKYNLNIGALDMYAGDTALNGDYDLNVIGIGRQNATTMVLAGGQAGFGIEAPASIADDGDYVFAGHKQAVNSFVTAGIPASVTRRWSRVWNVEVTDINNNVGATVAFDYSDSGLAIGAANAFRLLRSTDGGTTWVDVGATANVQGDAITFSLNAAQLSSALYTLGDSARPLVLNSPGAANYVIGGAALAIDPSLVLTADGRPTMTGATVSVGGFVGGDADVLSFTPVGAITGSYSSGVLTLSGTDSAANYQAALRSVTFAKATYQAMPFRALNFTVTDSAGQIGTSSRAVSIASTAAANTIQWDGASDADGDGINWSDRFNWAGDVLPDANDVALFAGLATGTINVSSAVVVGSISFTNSGSAYTIQNTGGSLQLTSAASTITQTGTTSNTISSAVNFAGVGIGIDVAASTTLTLAGDISGTGNLDKNGLGVVVLSGTNTYTGATNINNGTLRLAGLVVPQVPAGAVAIYTFDSVNGATVNNFGTVSAAENGNLVAGATIVGGGISGNAMSTAGSVGARMEIGTSPGISLAGGNWTGAAWFNGIYPTPEYRTLFRGGPSDHQIIIQVNTDNLGTYANGNGEFRDSGADLPSSLTGWHHIAAVGSGSTTTFFIDGVQVGVADR